MLRRSPHSSHACWVVNCQHVCQVALFFDHSNHSCSSFFGGSCFLENFLAVPFRGTPSYDGLDMSLMPLAPASVTVPLFVNLLPVPILNTIPVMKSLKSLSTSLVSFKLPASVPVAFLCVLYVYAHLGCACVHSSVHAHTCESQTLTSGVSFGCFLPYFLRHRLAMR